jgi:hypothetical protein
LDAIHELVSKCYDNSRTNELASKGDELEEEHTYELLPLAKKEYYEVFPYNGNQREILIIEYENLILPLQLPKEMCLLNWVHQHSLESENLFIYMMPMHRKRVRLQKNYALRSSKLLEVCITTP